MYGVQRVLENVGLREGFRTKRDEVIGDWRRLTGRRT
jgi:hypothetical protein